MKIELYITQFLGTPSGSSCARAGEMLGVSHDKVNGLLNEGIYTGMDLFDKVASSLILKDVELSLNDSLADKLYSNSESNLLVLTTSADLKNKQECSHLPF